MFPWWRNTSLRVQPQWCSGLWTAVEMLPTNPARLLERTAHHWGLAAHPVRGGLLTRREKLRFFPVGGVALIPGLLVQFLGKRGRGEFRQPASHIGFPGIWAHG